MLAYLLMSGIATGALYAMVAIGLVLVYRSTGHINFSHGELFMFGGFIAYTFFVILGVPYFLSLILAVIGGFVLGILSDRAVYRPLIKAPPLTMVLATVGFSFFLKGIARYFWGSMEGGDYVAFPAAMDPSPIPIGSIMVFPQQLLILAGAIVFVVGFTIFFRMTRAGKMMQATSENPTAAYLSGIRVERVYTLTWGAGSAIAAAAAVLMAPMTLLSPDVGFQLLLKAFAATVLGGLGSMPGAIVGGLLVGILESLGGGYVHSGVQDVSAFIVIIVVLVVRPAGLFGVRNIRDT
jgi:branched-chain amino acid transport system permease protein|tara:strand:- start:153 stop:1034 length:882 start_codon:yes stop_codon:yes gene_type:complete